MSGAFDAEKEAEALRKSVKGLGTADAELISIVARLDDAQRDAVVRAYAKKYERDLVQDVHDDTSGNYRALLEKLLVPREQAMAVCLRESVRLLGTNDYQLLTLLTSFRDLIPAATECYKKMYDRSLLDDVRGDTSCNYRKTLAALVQRKPPPIGFVDAKLIPVDVEEFYKAGEKRLGTDEDAFIALLTGRSSEHLAEVDKEYKRLHGHTLTEAIASETSGNFGRTLTAIVTPHYERLARAVEHAIKGPGTQERLLHIVFALSTREDLHRIAAEYKRLFKRDMAEAIKNDTSFNFRKLLLALMA